MLKHTQWTYIYIYIYTGLTREIAAHIAIRLISPNFFYQNGKKAPTGTQADTWRNDNVIITSKRRRNIVLA